MRSCSDVLRLFRFILLAGFSTILNWTLVAQDADGEWPREFPMEKGSVVIYQPQAESFKDNILTGRAAMALKLNAKPEPIFGAFWFTAKITTDKDSRTATLTDLDVTRVRWADATPEQQETLSKIVENRIPEEGVPISLDRLSASLATAERESKTAAEFKNEPPKIIFTNELSVLLFYDGAPRYEKVGDSPYERVSNTPMLVVKESKSGTHYLSSGSSWFSAQDAKGPWKPGAEPPKDLLKMLPPDSMTNAKALAKQPKIVVATEPTELVVFDGEPAWTSLPEGELLYAKNTESAVLREVSSNAYYLLISGRWFRSGSTDGPWKFVRPDSLPAGFAKIPPGSDIGLVRASVAGTDEAQDALLDAAIPQTTAIDRKKTTLTVIYDGAPKFLPVTGTEVEYAENTSTQVLRIDKRYYAVDNGVWFEADSAGGPWAVADSVPRNKIETIPASSPVYNVTHVYVYESTPQVVYVGYTPGYMYSYPYYGVVVYGTGYYYPPPVGIYYPRPVTYGLHVSYNPYTGWGVGMTVSNGFLTVGIGFGGGYGGYYRPGYPHYPPYHHPGYGHGGGWYGSGGYRPPPPGGYRPPSGSTRPNTGGTRPGGGSPSAGQLPAGSGRPGDNNLYNRPQTKDRMASSDRASQKAGVSDRAGTSSNRSGRVTNDASLKNQKAYADRDGNVHRSTGNNQWETRQNNSWNKNSAAANNNRQQLNRDQQARNRGASRQQMSGGGSHQTRSAPARSGGGGGGRRR